MLNLVFQYSCSGVNVGRVRGPTVSLGAVEPREFDLLTPAAQHNVLLCVLWKYDVYTVWIFICICMSLRVFLSAKKMKFLTKGGIHCISQVFPWHFYFMCEHSLVKLTEHDDRVLLISSYIVCIHICTAAFIVHISVYR